MKAKILSVIVGLMLISVMVQANEAYSAEQSSGNGSAQQDEQIIKGNGVSSISQISIGRDNSIYVVDHEYNLYTISRVDADSKKITPIKTFSGGKITSFVAIKGSYPWEFVFTANGKIFAYDAQTEQKIIRLGSFLKDYIRAVYQDKENHQLYAISNMVYTPSDRAKYYHDWVVANDAYTVQKEYEKDKLAMKKAINEIQKENPDVTCMAQSGNSKVYCGMKGGSLKLTGSAASSSGSAYYSTVPANQVHPFDFNVTYVAPALGPVADNKAIYRVDITENKYTADQLFTQGRNGFGYTFYNTKGADSTVFSRKGIVENQSNIYPINAIKYNETDGSLTLRPLSVKCIGPDIAAPSVAIGGIAGYYDNGFKLADHSYSFNDSSFKNWTEVSGAGVFPGKPMVSHEDYEITSKNYKNYSISASFSSSESGRLEAYANGVCAIPILVTIKTKSNQEPISNSDSAYDKLVFFAKDSEGSYLDNDYLIGCDPFNIKCNNYAILPAECVEIGGKYVKYGYPPSPSNGRKGKLFYLFKGTGGG